MRTAHSSSYGGLPNRDPPVQRPPSLDRDLPEQRPHPPDRDPDPIPRTETLSVQRPPWTQILPPARRNMGPGTETPLLEET